MPDYSKSDPTAGTIAMASTEMLQPGDKVLILSKAGTIAMASTEMLQPGDKVLTLSKEDRPQISQIVAILDHSTCSFREMRWYHRILCWFQRRWRRLEHLWLRISSFFSWHLVERWKSR